MEYKNIISIRVYGQVKTKIMIDYLSGMRSATPQMGVFQRPANVTIRPGQSAHPQRRPCSPRAFPPSPPRIGGSTCP